MNYPRSERLADGIRLRKNRPLLLLSIIGFGLCVVGGWLMITAKRGDALHTVETETVEF